MARAICAEGLEKNHPELATYAATTLSGMPGSGELQIREAGTDVQARRRTDRVMVLGRNDTPALTRMGANMLRLDYNDADAPMARAALVAAATTPGDPIVADPGSLALLTLAQRVAASTIPVLIEGPTGTGKEVLSRFIHNSSGRADGPFIAVNCAAMPEAMLEAIARAPSPAQPKRAKASSAQPMAAPCCWTNWAKCRWVCRQSCYAHCKKAKWCRWAQPSR